MLQERGLEEISRNGSAWEPLGYGAGATKMHSRRKRVSELDRGGDDRGVVLPVDWIGPEAWMGEIGQISPIRGGISLIAAAAPAKRPAR